MNDSSPQRPLAALPKAHLHLHFTGSMSPSLLLTLAERNGVRLPRAFTDEADHALTQDTRGWFRFQRLYDYARTAICTTEDLHNVVHHAAAETARDGGRWLELQIEPSGFARVAGTMTAALDVVLEAARTAGGRTGCEVGIMVAASRVRHPLNARTLARLAARRVGQRAGTVVAFGLSNDERRGAAEDFAPAFRIARDAGLLLAPHAGELLGAASVAETMQWLSPDRIGHGVRIIEDPELLHAAIDQGIGFEVCPASNAALGVFPQTADVPLRRLFDAGAAIALSSDDPLIFRSSLLDQYKIARHDFGFSDSELAQLARYSFEQSAAPDDVTVRALADIDTWLQSPVSTS